MAVARRGVHEAGAGLCGDVVAAEHHLARAEAAAARRLLGRGERVLVRRADDGLALEDAHHLQALALGQVEPLRQRVDEPLRHDQLVRQRRVRHHRVIERAVDGDGEVGGQRPRRRRPDGHADVGVGAGELGERGGGLVHLEGRVHRAARVALGVLELGLGQRGAARRAPVHRLAPAVDVALEDHRAENADLRRLVLGLEREVRLLPVPPAAVPPERVALLPHRLFGEFGGALAQLERRQRLALVVLHPLEHLELDRQAVAVPPGHVLHLPPLQQHVPVDDVLEDLVERVADVQVAVRVRRPVVQHELVARVAGGELLVDLLLVPELLQLGLARHRVRALREVGERQRHRRLVRRLGTLVLLGEAHRRVAAQILAVRTRRQACRRREGVAGGGEAGEHGRRRYQEEHRPGRRVAATRKSTEIGALARTSLELACQAHARRAPPRGCASEDPGWQKSH